MPRTFLKHQGPTPTAPRRPRHRHGEALCNRQALCNLHLRNCPTATLAKQAHARMRTHTHTRTATHHTRTHPRRRQYHGMTSHRKCRHARDLACGLCDWAWRRAFIAMRPPTRARTTQGQDMPTSTDTRAAMAGVPFCQVRVRRITQCVPISADACFQVHHAAVVRSEIKPDNARAPPRAHMLPQAQKMKYHVFAKWRYDCSNAAACSAVPFPDSCNKPAPRLFPALPTTSPTTSPTCRATMATPNALMGNRAKRNMATEPQNKTTERFPFSMAQHFAMANAPTILGVFHAALETVFGRANPKML